MLGFHDFTAGDTLTAAQLDSIIRQTRLVFDDTSDRDTELSGLLEEGLHCYCKDSKTEFSHDGSNWIVYTEPKQAWSPSVSQPTAVTGTVNRGWSRRSNGLWEARLKWTASATGSAGNAIVISTPYTMEDANDAGGSFVYSDAGVARVGTVRPNTTTSIALAIDGSSGSVGDAPAITIASSDILYLTVFGTCST